jgi:hypothetical protein
VDFDTRVKTAIYAHIAATTNTPDVAQVAGALGAAPGEIREAFGRLYRKRVLVLEPDGETIRMAPPFSGIATQHRAVVGGKEYAANCAWDALGVPAALHAEAEVFSRCEQSLEALHIRVRGGRPEPVPCVIHFAVPAAHWWDDIVHT